MMESKEVDVPTENIVDDDFMNLVPVGLEKENKEATDRLDPKKIDPAVTRSHTREQQANTAGSRFRATCGEPLNCDDFLSAKQRCHKVDN